MSGWGWVVFAILLGLFALQTWHFIERTWDLKQQFYRDLNAQERLYREQTKIMQQVRVEDVLGRTEEL